MNMNAKFEKMIDEKSSLIHEYLPHTGDGENLAEQLVTTVNRIAYRWYNDGDVYDTTNCNFGQIGESACTVANWIASDFSKSYKSDIIYRIYRIRTEDEYELLLADMLEYFIDEVWLKELATKPKIGSIYEPSETPFKVEMWEDEEEEYEEVEEED